MSIALAYTEIDRTLRARGLHNAAYVLWGAVRSNSAVIDFAVPIGAPYREQTLQVIESVLAEFRGRDRISTFALELARFALENERRNAA